MAVPEKMHAPADMAECAANWTPVPLSTYTPPPCATATALDRKSVV